MTGVTLHTGTPGWKVYTISSTSAMTRTITATVASDTTINIVVCGGGGGSYAAGERAGGGGGGRFREASKLISATNPTQTFTCTIPSIATGNQVGGTSSITFSVPSIGDISCGGGGIGLQTGGSASNAPANGGGGGGGGFSIHGGFSGGTGVFGGNGGTGDFRSGGGSVGGGGGAGGAGGNANGSSWGSGGVGVSTTLAGILSVYNSSYKFCSGGNQNATGSTYGGGAQGADSRSSPAYPSRPGNAGAIIIAVPV